MISKKLCFKVDKVNSDSKGCFPFVRGQLDDFVITLATIYALNSLQIQFLKETFNKLQAFQQGDLIIAGEFNYIANSKLDCSYKKNHVQISVEQPATQLQSLFVEFNLCDIWRLKHPGKGDFTYYSPR